MSTQPISTLQMNLGALLIGVLVSCFLFGIVTLQMYLYYMKFPNDSIRLKSMVAFVWVCELGLTICVCHILYYLTIVGYGEPRYFFTLPASLASAVIFSGIIGPIVQMFFAERIRKISGGKLIISILCWIMAWFRLVMSFVTAAKTIRINSITEFQVQCKWLLTTVLAVCVAVDFVIAVSLCYYLTKRKAQSMERTARIIDKIVAWAIQTGLLTTAASGVVIICFLVMPNNFIWLALFTCMARLFSNTFLASLNSRSELRDFANDRPNMALPLIDTFALSHNDADRQKTTQVMIQMTQTTEVSSDDSKPISMTEHCVAV